MRLLTLAALLSTAALPAAAQQVLYTPVPPKGSAYIRFVNALDAPAQLAPDFLAAQTVGAATTDRVTAYAVVEHVDGKSMALGITAGGRHGHAAVTAAPGSFVTVILVPTGQTGIVGTPVVDQTDFNQTKSHLAFYNATPACAAADLKLQPANATVFAAIPPGSAKSRSVNPVTATVVPDCGGTPAPAVALKGLEPGGMYSIWLMQPEAAPISFISRDSTLPWKP